MKKYLLLAAIPMAWMLNAEGQNLPQLGKAPIDDVIAAMTLEEKAKLVVGNGRDAATGSDSVLIGATRKIIPGAAGTTYPIERLGIPAIVMADGPAGLRISPKREGDSCTYYCTHFPIGTLLASTWNPALVQSVGKAIGNEVLEYGVDVLLGPGMNIHRNPLCGRNYEYYSEDPILTGEIASAYVNGVQSNGVGTSVKHFAANNQETNRTATDAHISPRALREIYLKGFETVVRKSQPWTLMTSYNYLNGTYTAENPELLTSLLRNEWGYKGMVVTDWYGGQNIISQVKAGNDLNQPGRGKYRQAIVEAVKNGTLDEADLDRNVRHVLELILKTPRFKKYKFSNHPDLKGHAKVTRESAAEGMVLLKNENNALPLATDTKTVALFGCTSYDFTAGGTGSGNVNRAYTVSLIEGLENAGYRISEDLANTYKKHVGAEKERIAAAKRAWYLPEIRPDELALSLSDVRKQAKTADVAIITIGRTSGEFVDRKLNDFHISDTERNLIENVSKAFHKAGKNVVVVLNIGGVVETASWKHLPDAILCAWQAGQEGGNSVADILGGKVSPSGKLPMTFPLAFEDVPSSANFPIDYKGINDISKKMVKKNEVRNVDYTDYEENIYVGYRYYNTFDKNVSYPFGFGLSYASFAYENPSIQRVDSVYRIKVDVKNIGKNSGKEVVQVYVAAPDLAKSDKPVKELKAFAKTAELKPGESTTVTMTVPYNSLASYNENTSSWEVAGGTYKFIIGSSSRDNQAELLADAESGRFKTNDILKLQTPISILSKSTMD